MAIRRCVSLLIVLFVQCTGVAGSDESLITTVVTLYRVDDNDAIQVDLTSLGAARVRLGAGISPKAFRTILFPIVASDVSRISKAVVALSDAEIDFLRLPTATRFPGRDWLVIQCSRPGGRTHKIEMRSTDLPINPMIGGLVADVGNVGMLSLARAIEKQDNSRQYAANGELEKAVPILQAALAALDEWERSHLLRIAGPTAYSEPGANIEFSYPDQGTGRWIVVNGTPKNVLELPGINREWAFKLLQNGWHKRAVMLDIEAKAENVFVVGWKEVKEKDGTVLWPGLAVPKDNVNTIIKMPILETEKAGK
jgi:hypothetical protein